MQVIVCGIVGWISPGSRVQEQDLVRMREKLVHRGPDGAGFWIDEKHAVGLAHRRLSIIDLSEAASQPMIDSARQGVIVFNGEIFNHRELRRELEQNGCEFLTDHSDTEVILVGYRFWGLEQLLQKLTGIFAFALYDLAQVKVICARDRMGVKPLYWGFAGEDIVFASEIKALLAHKDVQPRLNLTHLRIHMAFRSLPAPMTLFENISKLARGEYLIIDPRSGDRSVVQYWNPLASVAVRSRSESEASEELLYLLRGAVSSQLESDVPVGVFLSGGLDSATLLSLASEEAAGLSSYTASYPGYEMYDETEVSKQCADQAYTRHHDVEITVDDYVRSMTAVAYHQDEPIAAPVCVSVYLLSKRARETGVPVILAGEGSDELFIGYESWLKVRDLQRMANRFSGVVGSNVLRKLSHLGANTFGDWSRPGELLRHLSYGGPAFWGGAMELPESASMRLFEGTSVPESVDIYRSTIEPMWRSYCDARDSQDVIGWMTYVDITFRLPELILPRLDKMGMAFSTEGRVPFLDHKLAEFVFSLPPHLRGSRGRETKPLLRKSVSGIVSPSIRSGKKQGFQAPVREWKTEKSMHAFVACMRKFARRSNLFNVAVIDELISRRDDRLYFGILNFMIWYCLYIDNLLADELGSLPVERG